MDQAAAPRDKYDQWVFDTFGVDPSAYPPLKAGQGGDAAESGATAVGGAGKLAEDQRNVASMEKTTLVAGTGSAPAMADAGGGGVELAAYKPESGTVGGGAPSLDPVNKGLDTAGKALDVLDKFGKLAADVIKATANSTGINDDRSTKVSVTPSGIQSMDLQGGEDLHADFHLSIQNVFGSSLGDLTMILLWRGGLSYKGHGRFLEDVRLLVNGEVSLFQEVDIVVSFGHPTNAGTQRDPVASLPVDITCSLKSMTITRGQKVFSGSLSGASGYKATVSA